PGYEPYDAEKKPEYGYGRYQNVLTGLEIERLLSAAGPSGGEVRRPSDGRPAKNVAWIQCVGSRDVAQGQPYCSAVCCTYTAKHLIMAREHDPDLIATVFHNGIRTYGKGFEQYFRQASQMPGVRYIRSLPSAVKEMQQTGNLLIRYWNDETGIQEEEFDLVALSVGMAPSPNARELAQKVGVEVDEHGFCRTSPFSPVSTSRDGVFVAGVFAGPADIPDSVTRACAAASSSAQVLSSARGTLTTEKEYPPEKEVSAERPRIGVFVCRCGTNIGRVVDVPSVVRHARNLPNVVHAEECLFACSIDSSRRIGEAIEEAGLNRVVVAACTPRTHEPLFQDTIRGAGLNPSLFEMANIREQCSWVHMRQEEEATGKAQHLADMAVARARLARPTRRLTMQISRPALVLGGGVAGMTAALCLAEQSFPVHVVEKAGRLGGVANRLRYSFDGTDVRAQVAALVTRVEEHPLITVHPDTTVREVRGYVGNFSTLLAREADGQERQIEHGAIIVATGAREWRPTEYLCGEDDRILTLLDLEGEIAADSPLVRGASNVVFIQCVGSRSDERPYCSRVCCRHTVKLALKLRELRPDIDVHVLYRDVRTYGLSEELYQRARELGVRFLRYEPENPPQVSVDEHTHALRVVCDDLDRGSPVAIGADIVALAGATVPGEDN
ncbi:MAG: FAD-dependent oxidoreductase, partial [Dehalococcoidia bacterium]